MAYVRNSFTGENADSIVNAADHILTSWRAYTDEDAFIFSETDGEPHNTITPIARMRDGKYELDLVLRNNITTKEAPWEFTIRQQTFIILRKKTLDLSR